MDSASQVGSDAGISFLSGAKRRRKSEASSSNMRENTEQDMIAEIGTLLTGRLDIQILVLRQLKTGALERKAADATTGLDAVAPSTNKLNMLSIANWAQILHEFDPDRFVVAVLLQAPKQWLCKTACFIGMLDEKSALYSRSVSQMAAFLRKRCDELYARNRHGHISIGYAADKNKITSLHDYDADGGCFYDKPIDGEDTHVLLWHRGTDLNIRVPKTLWKNPDSRVVSNNHSEELSTIIGEYDDIKVNKLFAKQDVQLPALWFSKRIIQDIHSPKQLTLTADNLQAHARNAEAPRPAVAIAPGDAAAPPAIPEGEPGHLRPDIDA